MYETYIEQACADFRRLLNEQLQRQDRMEQGEKATDFTSKPVITIGVAGGEGCGMIFKKGKILRKVPEENLLEELLKEIERL